MPADRLNCPAPRRTGSDRSARAVLDVLSGAPLDEAAARTGLEPADLAGAVEVFCQAGQQALEQQAVPEWWQVCIQFTDWHTAEATVAAHLAPLLLGLQKFGDLTAWWFIRKFPCWRVRLHVPHDDARHRVRTALDALVADTVLDRWWTGIYEPEIAAFGGPAAMTAAHDLFVADSCGVLDLLSRGPVALGRRELSVLLCTRLMRAAGLEWYEQGDVWHRVTEERPLPADVPTDRLRAMTDNLKQLILADTHHDGPLFGTDGPVEFAAEWTGAFDRVGRTLGAAARTGSLDRGLRHILSYHVIFHWNRLGLPVRTQSILARTARDAILEPLPV